MTILEKLVSDKNLEVEDMQMLTHGKQIALEQYEKYIAERIQSFLPIIFLKNGGGKILIELVYILKTDCQGIPLGSSKVINSYCVLLLTVHPEPEINYYKNHICAGIFFTL